LQIPTRDPIDAVRSLGGDRSGQLDHGQGHQRERHRHVVLNGCVEVAGVALRLRVVVAVTPGLERVAGIAFRRRRRTRRPIAEVPGEGQGLAFRSARRARVERPVERGWPAERRCHELRGDTARPAASAGGWRWWWGGRWRRLWIELAI